MGLLARWQARGRRARRLAHVEALLLDGDQPGAISELEVVVEENPDDRQTVRRLVELHAEAGNVPMVVSHMTALLDWDVRTFDLLRTATFDSIRDDSQFLTLYRTAVDRLLTDVEEDPAESSSRFRLAEAHEALEDTEAAHAVYEELSTHEDPDVQTRGLYSRARLAAVSGDAGVAGECLVQLMAIAPEHLDAFEADAAFDAVRDSTEIAEARRHACELRAQSLWRALQEDPANAHPYRQLVELYTAHQELELAVDTAQQAIEHFPTDIGLIELLANVRFDAGDRDGAMDAYQDVLRMDVRHAWALYRTGVIYSEREERAAASSAYREALEAVREDAGLAFLLARGFARIGDTASALDALGTSAHLSAQFGTEPPDRLLRRIDEEPDLGDLRGLEAYGQIIEELRSSLDDEAEDDW